jgi:xanthine dehydrogenase YagS FAD-binding subunit
MRKSGVFSIDFAIVSVWLMCHIADGICTSARIVLGAVAPGPHRAEKAEAMLSGKPLNEKTAVMVAEAALEGAVALKKNAYKINIVKTLVKKAIEESRGA